MLVTQHVPQLRSGCVIMCSAAVGADTSNMLCLRNAAHSNISCGCRLSKHFVKTLQCIRHAIVIRRDAVLASAGSFADYSVPVGTITTVLRQMSARIVLKPASHTG